MSSPWPFHPFLFAAFPILALFSRNLYEVATRELFGPIALSLSFSAVVLALSSALVGDVARGALITTTVLALVFTHQRYVTLVGRFRLARSLAARQGAALGVELALATALGLVFVLIPQGLVAAGTWLLNIAAVLLLVLGILGIVGRKVSQAEAKFQGGAAVPTALPSDAPMPDIYYIILDGYARSDVLRDLYGLDNEPFLNELEDRGFFVARRSRANYSQTVLSLGSSLNFRYLDEFSGNPTSNKVPLTRLIRENSVARTLKPLGYQTVAFATGYTPTTIAEADHYWEPRWTLTEFHALLSMVTPFQFLLGRLLSGNPYQAHRERILFLLERLPEASKIEAPTFTFAHILAPHPPFVFNENGEDVSPYAVPFDLCDGDDYRRVYGDTESYLRGYRAQLLFLNTQILRTIDRIQADSPRPPIIVLQADHGPGAHLDYQSPEHSDMRERLGILNAYALPSSAREDLSEDISPVNTFRVLLRHCVGAELDLLENRGYFSTSEHPFLLTDVTEQVNGSELEQVPESPEHDVLDPRPPH